MPNLLGSGATAPRPGSSLEGQWSGGGLVIAPGLLANTSTARSIAPPGSIRYSPNLVTTFPYTVTPSANIAGSGGSGSSSPLDFYGTSPPIAASTPSGGGGGGGAPSKLPWLLAGGALLAFLYLGNQKKRGKR